MLTPGVTLAESQNLRLSAISEKSVGLYHGNFDLLLLVDLLPSVRCPCPILMAELVLKSLRPKAPLYIRDGTNSTGLPGKAGGQFTSDRDEIEIFGRGEMTDVETANVILHELIHSTGTASRCNRPFIADAAAFFSANPDMVVHARQPTASVELKDALLDEQQEELTAAIGNALVGPRLGIISCNSAFCGTWFERAAYVPLDILRAAIRDAQAACDFILPRE